MLVGVWIPDYLLPLPHCVKLDFTNSYNSEFDDFLNAY